MTAIYTSNNCRHVVLRMRTNLLFLNKHVEGEGAFRDRCTVSACDLCEKHENDILSLLSNSRVLSFYIL